jgi:hypothetical protein
MKDEPIGGWFGSSHTFLRVERHSAGKRNRATYEIGFRTNEHAPTSKAPNHAGPHINESVQTDIYIWVGAPAQVLTGLQNMNVNEGWNW